MKKKKTSKKKKKGTVKKARFSAAGATAHKIAVVDDDREMNKILESELTKEGYQVYLAFDGQEGLKMIKTVKPDFIILDIMMPKMDGYEVLELLKQDKDTEDIPVTMLTAMGLDEDIQKGINLGAIHYLTKPLRTKFLVKCIRAVLN